MMLMLSRQLLLQLLHPLTMSHFLWQLLCSHSWTHSLPTTTTTRNRMRMKAGPMLLQQQHPPMVVAVAAVHPSCLPSCLCLC